jgi:20S proteasome alpha/beta subunit
LTLTVALVGHNGMVAAADSRGTFGDPRGLTAQNDNMTKVFTLAPHVVGTLAGAAELGVQLMAEVQAATAAAGMDGVTQVMELVRTTTRTRYAEWFPGWQIQPGGQPGIPVRPELAMLVAGYDSKPDDGVTEPKVYQLISAFDFAPMLTGTGFGLQGVAQYALYLLNRLYLPDASIEELKYLASYVITETATQDGKVGGPVRMAIVTPGEGCAILTAAELEVITDGNAARSEQLRSSFFAGRAHPRRTRRRQAQP